MNRKHQKKIWRRSRYGQRGLAAVLIVCLLLTNLNVGVIRTYATEEEKHLFEIGPDVTAELEDGVLTVTGFGDTGNFTKNTAPFLDCADEIHSLVIEEGITFIGSYLFYGLGKLEGELVLPGSIVGFGDYAFSGASLEEAPKFSLIRNEFEDAEIVAREVFDAPVLEKEQGKAEQSGEGLVENGEETESDGETETGNETEVKEAAEATEITGEGMTTEPEKWTEAAGEGVTEPEIEAEVTEISGEGVTEPEIKESVSLEKYQVPVVSSNITFGETENLELEPATENETESATEAEPETESKVETESSTEQTTEPETNPASEPETDTGSNTDTNTDANTDTNTDINTDINTNTSQPTETSAAHETEPNENTDAETDRTIPAESSMIETESASATTEFITQQEIKHPNTLFYKGQKGRVICSFDNKTFLEAAVYAGYKTTYGFLAGDYHLSILVEEDQEAQTAIYTLVDADTEEAPEVPENYRFFYQWQIAEVEESWQQEQTSTATPSAADEISQEDDIIWVDIPEAEDMVYERSITPEDSAKKLRCVVTAVSLMRSRMADGEITMYSDTVSAAATIQVQEVYVHQTGGNDSTGDGTAAFPVKTLVKAVELLENQAGQTAESNQIILAADYKLDNIIDFNGNNFLKDSVLPITIKGITSGTRLIGRDEVNIENNNTYLCSDTIFENLTLYSMGHIYGYGHSITMGDQITSPTALYLYGAGQNSITEKIGSISVASGSYTRIAAYARNTGVSGNNVAGKKASITVSGTASVNTIISGNASGGVLGADVTVSVRGGEVIFLVGGSQGFNDTDSPYEGKTAIEISGGTVSNIYGAGSGRSISVPYFKGTLDINVTGGNVTNIYGSGSAAYIKSDSTTRSKVNITATGGTIGNIYAAGLGGDSQVGSYKNPTSGETTNLTPDTAADCGSLTGDATITIGGNAKITGSIYASGKGYDTIQYGQKNAYLNGNVTIRMTGGTVANHIYGGGAGSTKTGFETCARVVNGSNVSIELSGGTVEGSIYGGGEFARFEDSTHVTITGGIVRGNVYGGGKEGLVTGKANVTIKSGEITGSVYGGALGKTGGKGTLVNSGSTVNMSGGWIRGNLYGGSEVSDDGLQEEKDENQSGLVFVNLTGGTVSGKVFGGGYKGRVYGSTHLHIGKEALAKCNHYKTYPDEMPVLEVLSDLSVGGSVYAGGDFGGDEIDYNQITVEGYSHVYVDGTGYRFEENGPEAHTMNIACGVFGSGASCDAGDVRLVTLDHYGAPVKKGDGAWDVTSSLTSIQRADQVRLINSHVHLTGQSDVANENQTALYSLNRVGDGQYDSDKLQKLGGLGNSVSLIGGSTLMLDSALIEVANFKSVNDDGQPVPLTTQGLADNPNLVVLTTGTIFRISHTVGGVENYGAITGYSYMAAGDTAEAYAYARIKNADVNSTDGGFAVLGEIDSATGEQKELEYRTVEQSYRYWKVSGKEAIAVRDTVLTARTLGESEKPADGYSVAKGVIELPPAGAGSQYKIMEITVPKEITLVNAAKKNDAAGGWLTAWDGVDQLVEQNRIDSEPLNTFGLFMHPGSGFKATDGKVVSNDTADPKNVQTIIGAESEQVTDSGAATTPQLEFYLTYKNDAVTISQNLGNVVVKVERIEGGVSRETITMNINIVTKASDLSDQTVDLYATPGGSYTGKLIIPTGANRTLSLEGINAAGISLVGKDTPKSGHDVAVTMQPVKGQGWQSTGLMENAYDLKAYTGGGSIPIGSTDSRYEAQIDFVLYNMGDFEAKETTDNLLLTFKDRDNETVEITLEIHWKASIVSEIKTAVGKQYSELDVSASVSISQESSFTTAFVMNGSDKAEALWLELRQADGGKAALPDKTKLTLMGDSLNGFYWYQTTGLETDGRIPLNEFVKMWSAGSKLVSDIAKQTLTVIVQFEGTAGLPVGDYSLRLRNDTGADSIGAAFTVNTSHASVTLGGEDGLSQDAYNLTLKLWPGSDTRLADGAAVVFSPESGAEFPEGTSFVYGGERYYPMNGKVYIILGKPDGVESTYQMVMDTTNASGLGAGEHSLTTELYSSGINAGGTAFSEEVLSYQVTENPQYGLKVTMAADSSRIGKPGETVNFEVSYTIENAGQEAVKIQTEVLKKEESGYTAGERGWIIRGNYEITDATSNPQRISVTIPNDETPGTYRAVFRLGDKEAVYNLIVESSP